MKEQCLQFGAHSHLAGILTEPSCPSPSRRGVILVTAGLVPKQGPHRLYTELARRLAQAGFFVLRFDLGGIGESRQLLGGMPLRKRTETEISEAINLLVTTSQVEEIVVGGLCSGAEDSFRYAEKDTRVKAVLLIDPFAYRTKGWKWRHTLYRFIRRGLRAAGMYEPMILPESSLQQNVTQESCPPGSFLDSQGSDSLQGLHTQWNLTYHYMEYAESRRILHTLISRGTKLHFIYTGGMREKFNHRGQLQAMFPDVPFQELVTLDLFLHLEHTQLLEEDRELLIETITSRVSTSYH